MKSTVTLIGIATLIIALSLSTNQNEPNICNKLITAVENPSIRVKLNEIAKVISTQQSINTTFSESSGFLNYTFIKDDLSIDWHMLNMHEAAARIAIIGTNINYQDLSRSTIESVLIGSGRAFILVDINKNGVFHDQYTFISSDEIKKKIDNLIVVCRSNNYQQQ